MREIREPLAAVLSDEYGVLDPDTADTGDVDSRLRGDDVAGREDLLRTGRDVDGLMHIHADAVSEGMDELALELGFVDDLAGC